MNFLKFYFFLTFIIISSIQGCRAAPGFFGGKPHIKNNSIVTDYMFSEKTLDDMCASLAKTGSVNVINKSVLSTYILHTTDLKVKLSTLCHRNSRNSIARLAELYEYVYTVLTAEFQTTDSIEPASIQGFLTPTGMIELSFSYRLPKSRGKVDTYLTLKQAVSLLKGEKRQFKELERSLLYFLNTHDGIPIDVHSILVHFVSRSGDRSALLTAPVRVESVINPSSIINRGTVESVEDFQDTADYLQQIIALALES